MSRPRHELAAVAGLAAAAVLAWALIPTYPNYDSYYHLVWGRELVDGVTPSFGAYAAPTPHPLWLAVTALLSIAGEGADRLLVLVAVISHVMLMWAVYRLGTAVWDRRAGLAGALLAGSAFALLLYTARAYVDMPYLALVFWAAALEAEKPRRGGAVFVLLLLAGLLRPEAWLLSGLYWLWLWFVMRRNRGDNAARSPRSVWALLPWVVAAPLTWMLTDLLVTGDPLWSLNSTSALAEDLGRDTGLAAALREGVVFVSGTAREPVAAAALIGVLVAWRRREGASVYVPVALVLAGTAAFLLTSAAGLSVLPRYLTVPAVVLCMLAGYLVTRSRLLFGLAVLAGLVFVVVRADTFGRFADEIRFMQTTRDDLRGILLDRRVTAARRCGPVTLPNYRLVPDTRWYLDASRREVGARSARERTRGVALFYTDPKLQRRYGFADGASPLTNAPRPGFVPIARNDRFAAYAACRR